MKQGSRPIPAAAPEEIFLLSQTHTPLYGIDLKARFEALAQAFGA